MLIFFLFISFCMVCNYERKGVSFDKGALIKAVEKVLSGEMGYKRASKHYGLKKQTIRDHVKKRPIWEKNTPFF